MKATRQIGGRYLARVRGAVRGGQGALGKPVGNEPTRSQPTPHGAPGRERAAISRSTYNPMATIRATITPATAGVIEIWPVGRLVIQALFQGGHPAPNFVGRDLLAKHAKQHIETADQEQ